MTERLAFDFCIAHTDLLLPLDWHDELAWFFTAFHLTLLHAWHSRHSGHSLRLANALHLFSLCLRWLRLGTAFFHHGDQVHRTDGTFAGILRMHRRMHGAGVIIDVARFACGAFLSARCGTEEESDQRDSHRAILCKNFHG